MRQAKYIFTGGFDASSHMQFFRGHRLGTENPDFGLKTERERIVSLTRRYMLDAKESWGGQEGGQPASAVMRKTLKEVARELGVSEATIYTWKRKYGGMEVSDARRLKELEDENHRLKQIVADLGPDKEALKAVIRKNGSSFCRFEAERGVRDERASLLGTADPVFTALRLAFRALRHFAPQSHPVYL